MYEKVSALPPLESSIPPANSAPEVTAASGKREWEAGSVGYVNWAVERLVAGAKAKSGEKGKEGDVTWVDQMEKAADYVGSTKDVSEAAKVFAKPVEDMDVDG